MLGLYTPPAMTLQVVEAQAPKRTSIQKARDRLDNIMGITVRERRLINKEADEGLTLKFVPRSTSFAPSVASLPCRTPMIRRLN